jgi:hypothetical protein
MISWPELEAVTEIPLWCCSFDRRFLIMNIISWPELEAVTEISLCCCSFDLRFLIMTTGGAEVGRSLRLGMCLHCQVVAVGCPGCWVYGCGWR